MKEASWITRRTTHSTRPNYKQRRLRGLISAMLALALVMILSLAIGSRSVPLADILSAFWAYDLHNSQHLIIWSLRLPRTFVAVLAGTALGVSGALMQVMSRNPLAEPGLLGINSGAAVAVVIGASVFDLTDITSYVWFSFLGAGLAGTVVFFLGQGKESVTHPMRLVLVGAGLSIMLGSMTGIVLLNASLHVLDEFRHWSAGSLDGRGFDIVGVLSISALVGLFASIMIAGRLNALALGPDIGQALGVNVRVTSFAVCVIIMVLAGSATAGAGPIGFVGMISPHLARVITGQDYRWIIPVSGLFAALLFLGADVLGRVIAAPSEVAAGIVVLLMGGPFFILIVRKFRLASL